MMISPENSNQTPQKQIDSQDVITPISSPQSTKSIGTASATYVSEIKNEHIDLVEKLVKETFGGKTYYLTGGMALYSWAKEYGKEKEFLRPLKDIDIMTNEDLITYQKKINATSVPGPGTTHLTGQLGNFAIDVIKSGMGLGSMIGGATLKSGVQVVSLTTLLHTKLNQTHETKNNLSEKDVKDIALLQSLLKLHKEKHLEKRKDSNVPDIESSKRMKQTPQIHRSSQTVSRKLDF